MKKKYKLQKNLSAIFSGDGNDETDDEDLTTTTATTTTTHYTEYSTTSASTTTTTFTEYSYTTSGVLILVACKKIKKMNHSIKS